MKAAIFSSCLILLTVIPAVRSFGQTHTAVDSKPNRPTSTSQLVKSSPAPGISATSTTLPLKISYQGLLATSAGIPLADGSYDLQFHIFEVPTGGTALWSESHAGVPLERGIFNVILGSVASLNIAFDKPLFVEATVTSGPGMSSPMTFSPRSEFTSAPYALRTDTSNYAVAAPPVGTAGGGLAGSYPNPVLADNSVSNSTIVNNAVTALKIADGGVNSAKIQDGSVQRTDAVTNFKAPYADTADYAKFVPPISFIDSARIAGTVPQNAITSGLISADAVTSLKILDGTIVRGDAAAGFKAPYSDTSDYSLGAPPAGSAGGDLTGSYPDPTVKMINGTALGTLDPAVDGQALSWNATLSQWTPSTIVNSLTSGSGISLTSNTGNPTVSSTGVISLTASPPLSTSGGQTPTISLSGIVPIAKGGTGSSTQNFVDLSTAQSIGGAKTFTANLGIGAAPTSRKLEVGGSVKVSDTLFASNVSSLSPLRLQTSGTTRMYIDDGTGNVGIGTPQPPIAKLEVRGDIRLGPVGQYRAPAGEENLRIIRGVVSQTGSIIVGSGFTVSHPAIGQFTITFSTAFAGPPAVTATADNGGVITQYAIVSTAGVTSSWANFRVFGGDVTAGPVAGSLPFHFIAIGPR